MGCHRTIRNPWLALATSEGVDGMEGDSQRTRRQIVIVGALRTAAL